MRRERCACEKLTPRSLLETEPHGRRATYAGAPALPRPRAPGRRLHSAIDRACYPEPGSARLSRTSDQQDELPSTVSNERITIRVTSDGMSALVNVAPGPPASARDLEVGVQPGRLREDGSMELRLILERAVSAVCFSVDAKTGKIATTPARR